MGFSNSVIINYPVEEVFKVFIRTAKRDFPKFNENNPIGCKVEKKVGAYSSKSAKMVVEIVDFKKNELYKIKSTNPNSVYISMYEFEPVDENSTKLTLSEEEVVEGWIPGFNSLLQNISFKSRVKRRFIAFVDALEKEIEDYRVKMEKNAKGRAEEKAKEAAKLEAKKAKEAAKKAQEEARKAKEAAAKAIREAKLAEEEAKKAQEEAEAKASGMDSDEIEEVEDTSKESEN